MYVVVFVEKCSMGMCSSWVHCTQCWVSLIAGVGYRVEQWGGKWDGTMGGANSCNWLKVVLAICVKALASSQRPYEQVQCCHLF